MYPSYDLHVDLYAFFNFLGWVLLFVFNLCHWKQKKKMPSIVTQGLCFMFEDNKTEYPRRFNICMFVEILLLSHIQFFSGIFMNVQWGRVLTNGADNYFGMLWFAPLVYLAVCALCYIPPLQEMDLVAPAYALSLVSFKLACFCAGCCYGVKMHTKYYNFSNSRWEFPVQLLEGFVALVIFVLLLVYRKWVIKKTKKLTGTVLPLYVILYSATRFVTEFWRDDFSPVFGRLTVYHLQCLAGVVIGIIEFIVIMYIQKRKEEKQL